MKKQKTVLSRIAVSIIIITSLFVISDRIIQSTVAQTVNSPLKAPGTQTVQNQTSISISPDQLDTTGLASTLIEDAKDSVQNGETQKVISYLNLAQQQLSTSGGNELVSMLIEDATESVQNGETQKVISYLNLAQQQLSTSDIISSSSNMQELSTSGASILPNGTVVGNLTPPNTVITGAVNAPLVGLSPFESDSLPSRHKALEMQRNQTILPNETGLVELERGSEKAATRSAPGGPLQ